MSVPVAQTDELFVEAIWESGGREITVLTEEKPLGGGSWIETEEVYSTSFRITDLAASGSHNFFVAGVTDRGEDVVEGWRLDEQAGSFLQESPTGPTEIVEPPYQQPTERPRRGAPQRSVVFQGDLAGIFTYIAVEPEVRQVYGIVAGEDAFDFVPNRIYAFDVETGDALEVFNSDDDPFLRYPLAGMEVREHAALGRAVFLLVLDTDVEYAVLWLDANGIPTGGSAFTHQDYLDSGGDTDWRPLSG